jgi:hypothetical protein
MPIVSPNETAAFLGIDSSHPGLAASVAQAEALVAGKLRLAKLDLDRYQETRWVLSDLQVFMPRNGPIQLLNEFEVDGESVVNDVMIYSNKWGVIWNERPPRSPGRAKLFKAGSLVMIDYAAGWTASDGLYPIPDQVSSYVMSLAGLTLDNLLASGVYDTKLGDMTIKIQRETLEQNLAVYDKSLMMHARSVWG